MADEMTSAETSRDLEARVIREREELARTLAELKEHLKPSHLLAEALSGGAWLSAFSRFARRSPASWTVMGIASALAGHGLQRRLSRGRRSGDAGDRRRGSS